MPHSPFRQGTSDEEAGESGEEEGSESDGSDGGMGDNEDLLAISDDDGAGLELRLHRGAQAQGAAEGGVGHYLWADAGDYMLLSTFWGFLFLLYLRPQ